MDSSSDSFLILEKKRPLIHADISTWTVCRPWKEIAVVLPQDQSLSTGAAWCCSFTYEYPTIIQLCSVNQLLYRFFFVLEIHYPTMSSNDHPTSKPSCFISDVFSLLFDIVRTFLLICAVKKMWVTQPAGYMYTTTSQPRPRTWGRIVQPKRCISPATKGPSKPHRCGSKQRQELRIADVILLWCRNAKMTMIMTHTYIYIYLGNQKNLFFKGCFKKLFF